jgi:hypothetical protein
VGASELADIPYAEAKSGTETITNSSVTKLDLETSSYDNGATTTTSALIDLTNNEIVLRRTGLWLVSAHINWVANTTGYRNIVLIHSTSSGTQVAAEGSPANPASLPTRSSASNVVYASGTTSVVYANVLQTSGGNLDCDGVVRAVWLGNYS